MRTERALHADALPTQPPDRRLPMRPTYAPSLASLRFEGERIARPAAGASSAQQRRRAGEDDERPVAFRYPTQRVHEVPGRDVGHQAVIGRPSHAIVVDAKERRGTRRTVAGRDP